MNSPIVTTGTDASGFSASEPWCWRCAQCGGIFAPKREGGTGYAVDEDDRLICYACCGENDARELENAKPGERFVHYLTEREGHYEVSNWPGTLRIEPYRVKPGSHNIGRTRYDVWFSYRGKAFHGVNIGDNQVLRIRALKEKHA